MSLAKKWKESPLVSLVVTVIAIGSTTFAFVQYFAAQRERHLNEKHSLEVETLKAEIASFKLSLNDANTFDLNSIVLKTGDSNSVPSGSQFFENDSFYSVQSTDHWDYRNLSESEYYKEANIDLGLSEAVKEATRRVAVHTWKSGTPILVGSNEGELVRLQPTILVQRMDDKSLAIALGLNPSELAAATSRSEANYLQQANLNSDSRGRNSVVIYNGEPSEKHSVYSALREDRTGKFFQLFSFHQFQASLVSATTHYSLRRVQKLGDLLYAQSTTRFDNAMVDGRRTEKYYLHQEDFFVADESQVYLIRMTVPSSEPVVDQNQRAEMTRWIQQFRIVRE